MLVLDGHKSAVYALAFDPDGGRLASGDHRGNVLLWSGGEPVPIRTSEDAKQGSELFNALAFSPDGDRVTAAAANGLIDIPTSRSSPTFLWAGGCTSLACVGRQLLAVGDGDRNRPSGGSFWLFDRRERATRTFSAPQGVRSVSAAGERVAWSEWGRVAYVWDIRKPDRVKLPLAAEAPCVALAPDGTQLAAGLDNYKVKLFDVARKQERRSLDGHTGRVTGVAFTPDGGTVVSGSWDGTVRLWDAASGDQRVAFKWPVGRVTSLAVSPDGLRLAVGGDTGAIVLADLD